MSSYTPAGSRPIHGKASQMRRAMSPPARATQLTKGKFTSHAQMKKGKQAPKKSRSEGLIIFSSQTEYKIGSNILGAGSFSQVVLGKCARTNESVAVKVIKLSRLPVEMKADAENENKYLSQLEHKHVLKLRKAWEENGIFFMVFDYYSSTLFSLVNACGKRGLGELLSVHYLRHVLLALEYLHSLGIVHRDIKLENVLIDPSSFTAVLADFGFAEKMDPARPNKLKRVCGSPSYVAPEIMRRQPYGPAVDVWACGVLFFASLTARFPFDGPTPQDTIKNTSMGKYELKKGDETKISQFSIGALNAMFTVTPSTRPSVSDVLNMTTFASETKTLGVRTSSKKPKNPASERAMNVAG